MEDFILKHEKPSEKLKQRYVKHIDGYPLRLYIFEKRLSEPFPRKIDLTLGRPGEVPKKEIYTTKELQEKPSLRNEPIYDELYRLDDTCVNSVVFQPYDRDEKPTFGEFYVLRSVMKTTFAEGEDQKEIAILVEW